MTTELAYGPVKRTTAWWTRFTDKVLFDPSGCWLWTGALDKDWYGKFYSDGKVARLLPHVSANHMATLVRKEPP